MELVLTIVQGPEQADIGEPSKKFRSDTGATIGRATDNSWVLPDPERTVSSKHAVLACVNGTFTITDQSTNGTFINDDINAIGAGNSAPLRDGDLVTMGPYRLQVKITAAVPIQPPAATAKPLPDGLESVDFLDGAAPPPPAQAAQANENGAEAADEFDKWLEPQAPNAAQPWNSAAPAGDPLPGLQPVETDPLAALDKSAGQAQQRDSWALENTDDDPDWWKTSFSDHAPANSHAMPPVNAQPDPQLTPPDSWETAAQQSPPIPPAQPAPDITAPQPHLAAQAPQTQAIPVTPTAPAAPVTPPAPAAPVTPPAPTAPVTPVAPVTPTAPVAPKATADNSGDLAQKLGLTELTAEQQQALVGEAADILRESVQRLMGLLSARASIKNELRVERTMIQATENNPLKFSPNPQAALAAMFGGAGGAFVSPSAAVKEGFDDISDHQVAVLVGMKAAFDAMLSHFDPKHLERRLDRQQSRSLLTSKNARLWEQYTEHFQHLKSDKETSYQKLFGEKFAEAYELQLAKLKGLRRL
ncbi:type VI secretion system-associated FHA domain protein TagH [Exilibacterium tricleocarpae]|uniref:Type VI secretion system-associated FHA domain protein TagH n=1 Tax=Exilibacterium tricleocarpae TaxID=2591008 RepID=A0A545SPW7_9GAMM|nr:type VI secretion system-associated FHA domain protein TagH [Exilibacterium tricleocarpae]TQV66906.1 type VI secretion system-associated FHA domain protein TagH [Exilibacterium tricleocarpae]